MSRIKHILFDCDGVLVDTEYVAAIKMTAMMASLGADLSVDDYLRNLSGSTFSAIMSRYFGDKFSENETLNIINKVEEQVAAEVKLIQGMDKVLQGISIPKSVVSNSAIHTVKDALHKTGITPYFDNRIFSSEQVNKPKPAPDLYLFALAILGLNPNEIIVVEDSLAGTQAAHAANLRVVGFSGGSHILPGHEERLFKLGVKNSVNDAADLSVTLRDILND